MAEASISVAQDQFICPICLDLLKDPVTINCGHSYCMSCITDYWDQDDQKRVYSCFQCRQTFTPRPVLGKNTMLAEVVEKLKKSKLQAARPVRCYAKSGTCDICTGEKHKAVKSCLLCLESYCQTHFERHEEFRHKMTDDTGLLQEMICPHHDKLLKMYSRTEECCICTLCIVDEDETHDTLSLATVRTKKQEELKETQRKYQQRIQEKQKEIQELRETVETHKGSAQAAVEDSERIFTELICFIERSRSEVTQLIRDQEKAAVSQAEGLLKRLEQEIDDLRRRDAELEQLLLTDDHIHFLQKFRYLSASPQYTDSHGVTASFLPSFDDVGKCVSQLREKLEEVCKEEQDRISARVRCIEIIPTLEYQSRKEFQQYFYQFTLDSNTAHRQLCLSEGNRSVSYRKKIQTYFINIELFNDQYQVLCRESVCGRCYWEVEWSRGVVEISVSYKSISRKGDESQFGRNDQSWSLSCSNHYYSFWHNNKETKLPVVSRSRIGVYVDHSAGTLSFYSVSDTMTLILRVQTKFTQPLYPGFRVHPGSVKLCDLKV